MTICVVCFEKNNSKKFSVQVAPEPPTVEMLRDLVLYLYCQVLPCQQAIPGNDRSAGNICQWAINIYAFLKMQHCLIIAYSLFSYIYKPIIFLIIIIWFLIPMFFLLQKIIQMNISLMWCWRWWPNIYNFISILCSSRPFAQILKAGKGQARHFLLYTIYPHSY